MTWQVYLCECADKSLYTGIAKNLVERIALHNSGSGAKYTRSRRPVKLVYCETAENRSQAQRREYEIRKLPKKMKQQLVEMRQPD